VTCSTYFGNEFFIAERGEGTTSVTVYNIPEGKAPKKNPYVLENPHVVGICGMAATETLLVTNGEDGIVKVWDRTTFERHTEYSPLAEIEMGPHTATSPNLVFINGDILGLGKGSDLYLWTIQGPNFYAAE
jgi:hypothetical protein